MNESVNGKRCIVKRTHVVAFISVDGSATKMCNGVVSPARFKPTTPIISKKVTFSKTETGSLREWIPPESHRTTQIPRYIDVGIHHQPVVPAERFMWVICRIIGKLARVCRQPTIEWNNTCWDLPEKSRV